MAREPERFNGQTFAEIATDLGISPQLFTARVRKKGIEEAIAMGSSKRHVGGCLDGPGRMEQTTPCVCPTCGKEHKMLLFWLGRLPANKMCRACLRSGSVMNSEVISVDIDNTMC